LRTVFPEVNGEPVQRILPASALELPIVDVSRGDVENWVRREIARPVDMAAGPLFEAKLARIGDAKYLLLEIWHHLTSDARSAEILDEDISCFYAGEAAPALSVQF